MDATSGAVLSGVERRGRRAVEHCRGLAARDPLLPLAS
jgi:hypothetical protein